MKRHVQSMIVLLDISQLSYSFTDIEPNQHKCWQNSIFLQQCYWPKCVIQTHNWVCKLKNGWMVQKPSFLTTLQCNTRLLCVLSQFWIGVGCNDSDKSNSNEFNLTHFWHSSPKRQNVSDLFKTNNAIDQILWGRFYLDDRAV